MKKYILNLNDIQKLTIMDELNFQLNFNDNEELNNKYIIVKKVFGNTYEEINTHTELTLYLSDYVIYKDINKVLSPYYKYSESNLFHFNDKDEFKMQMIALSTFPLCFSANVLEEATAKDVKNYVKRNYNKPIIEMRENARSILLSSYDNVFNNEKTKKQKK